MGSTIENATIVTMDPGRRILENAAVHIEGGLIADVGPTEEVKRRNQTNDLRIDARGKVLLPNLVNAHTHTFQTLRRGWGADLPLTDWLRKVVWPLAGLLTPEDMALGATISCVESLKSGTSFLVDNTTAGTSVESAVEMARAYKEVGAKAGLALGVTSRTGRAEKMKIPKERFPYTIEESIRIIGEAADAVAPLNAPVSVWAAPVTIFSGGPELFRAAGELCASKALRFHTHIAETTFEVQSTLEDYGCREADFLERNGVLGPGASLAHCVWLEDAEMELIARRGASVVHNPICNMYLGSGIADVPKMLRKGVNVALGSDGGTCGSSHDMFGVMKSAALVHKARALDPGAITSQQVLEMATIGGARSAGMEAKIGSIEKGKSADVFLLDLHRLHSSPVGDLVSSIVYYAGPSNVESVIVDGRVVVEKGEVITVDEEKVLEESQRRADQLESDARASASGPA